MWSEVKICLRAMCFWPLGIYFNRVGPCCPRCLSWSCDSPVLQCMLLKCLSISVWCSHLVVLVKVLKKPSFIKEVSREFHSKDMFHVKPVSCFWSMRALTCVAKTAVIVRSEKCHTPFEKILQRAYKVVAVIHIFSILKSSYVLRSLWNYIWEWQSK